jgi:hypothetical protein
MFIGYQDFQPFRLNFRDLILRWIHGKLYGKRTRKVGQRVQAAPLAQSPSMRLLYTGPRQFEGSEIIQGAILKIVADYRIKSKLRLGVADCVQEIISTLEMGPLRRTPEMIRGLVPACISFQIPVKLGVKLVAATAALFWSVEHVFCNFELGTRTTFHLTGSSFSARMAAFN